MQVHPLDGHEQICDHSTGTFNYFLKVVPTEYQNPKGRKFHTSQFSVTGVSVCKLLKEFLCSALACPCLFKIPI